MFLRDHRLATYAFLGLAVACWPDTSSVGDATARTMGRDTASMGTSDGPTPYEEAWRWSHFTTESDLPSNRINRITEALDGRIWVTTPSGIAWFDDYRWHPIRAAGLVVNGAFMDGVVAVNAESVFVISPTAGPRLVCAGTGIGIPANGDTLSILRGDSLFLVRYDGASARVVDRVMGLPPIDQIFSVGPGRQWLNSGSALHSTRGSGWGVVLPSPDGEIVVAGGTNGEFQLVEDGSGHGLCYLLRPNSMQGLWGWDAGGRLARVDSEPREVVNALDVGPGGAAIVVYRPDVVRYRSGGAWRTLDLARFGIEEIYSIRLKDNGDLLVGTENGLYWYDASPGPWRTVNRPPPDGRNSINEILVDRDGVIWLGTGGGLEKRYPDGRSESVGSIGGTTLNTVTGLGEDREGNVWISSGSSFTGAFRWDGRRWAHVPVGDSPDAVAVHKIRKDRDGDLWFLGIGFVPRLAPRGQPGAFLLSEGRFIKWGEPEGLLHGRVYAFAEGSDGTYWFGTVGGISRWSPIPGAGVAKTAGPTAGRWTYWNSSNGFRGERVYAMTATPSGRVWFDEWGNGGNLGYVESDDSIRYVPPMSPRDYSHVYDILHDQDSILWLATDAGLYSFNGEEFLRFDAKSGLAYNRLLAVARAGNSLYVGTQGRGLAILDTKAPLPPPPVVLMENPIVEEDRALVRWRSFAYHGRPEPSLVYTRHSIDGGAWSEWERRSQFSASGLHPGSHRLLVQARGPQGQYDPGGAGVVFLVRPPWYLRPAYYIPTGFLVLSLVTVSVVYFYRKRESHRQLLRNQEQLRMLASELSYAEERERRRMASFLHDNISQALGFCRSKLHGLASLARGEEVLCAIRDVEGLLGDADRDARTLTFDLSPPILYDIGLEAALDWLCSQFSSRHAIPVAFSDDGKRKPLAGDARGLLYSSVRELLINAQKHSKADRLQVATERRGERIVVTVSDNGRGFQPGRSVITPNNGGFGLYSIRERLTHLRGAFEIESRDGVGTTIRLYAPLAPANTTEGGG